MTADILKGFLLSQKSKKKEHINICSNKINSAFT
jgi:hypothetical protein